MDWPLLAPLPPDARDAVMSAARRRTFGKGEVVFHEGDPADALHLVTAGRLAVQVSTPDGERATLNVLAPGAHVGELALMPHHAPRQRSATVIALGPAETRVLSAAAFHSVRDKFPAVNQILVDLLADRVRELSDRLLESMYVGLDRRVYRCLLRLGKVYAEGSPPTLIPLTQDQLSDLVGGTRPSVNQVLQRLQDQGVIELGRGRVAVLNPAALRRKAGL
jgi:CRP/FNR family transcriptional regulator, cyclic AMP receptor protein